MHFVLYSSSDIGHCDVYQFLHLNHLVQQTITYFPLSNYTKRYTIFLWTTSLSPIKIQNSQAYHISLIWVSQKKSHFTERISWTWNTITNSADSWHHYFSLTKLTIPYLVSCIFFILKKGNLFSLDLAIQLNLKNRSN